MRATIRALATRLLPWRRVADDMQRIEERIIQHLDHNDQALADGLTQQRAHFDAQTARVDESLGKLDQRLTHQDQALDELQQRTASQNDSIGQLEQRLSSQNDSLGKLEQHVSVVLGTLRPKRLFISTGYFATTMAATISGQQHRQFDDYLLITLDRQSAAANRQWAYQLKDEWASVQTVSHEDYYERTEASPELPFAGIEFEEIYSPFIEMAGFVEQHFAAGRHQFYEEGLTSYLQALRFAPPDENSRFFALAPTALRQANVVSAPIDYTVFAQVLRRSAQCYRIPRLSGERNVIIVTSGAPPNESADPLTVLDPYNELAATLLSKGYTVWVKDHPRVPLKDIFATSILAQLGAQLLETDAPLLETVISCNRASIAAIVSVYSSILVHSFWLFGIPAFSLRTEPIGITQQWWKDVQDAIVPDIAELMNSAPNDLERVTREFHNRNLTWTPPHLTGAEHC
ncbi:polysialyltransferase family glycosyltransferase [Paraburkholderia silviterrae]|uniref:Uncharacterized protein n=1 Tax=Paraburkholderia silviterrae TaxID=2528715 RepID=A0A4R5LYH2_9BURK|nr:polysialyltransferase family glycosyltransferase [Paraburkholderia silviterrae]TDG17399.1 hypothetical protein EYW47_37780 [Paraburkholderia silviterrae]